MLCLLKSVKLTHTHMLEDTSGLPVTFVQDGILHIYAMSGPLVCWVKPALLSLENWLIFQKFGKWAVKQSQN